MLIPLGFLAGSSGGVDSDFELIETVVLGSAQASITFSGLASYSTIYKHLQVRYLARNTTAGTSNDIIISRLNADSATNYNSHYLAGTGSSPAVSGVFSGLTGALTGIALEGNNTANSFIAGVIDLLDPYSTTKNKTFRTLNGGHSSSVSRIDLHSAAWRNTSSVTSWQLLCNSGNLAIGSRFSLYGIKG